MLGDIISKGLSLPVPGNIIGMIILLVLLCTKTIKLDQVEDVSDFLLNHLAFFFIPAGVGLISSFTLIKSSFIQIIFICILTTIITICVTGKVVEICLSKKKVGKKHGNFN